MDDFHKQSEPVREHRANSRGEPTIPLAVAPFTQFLPGQIVAERFKVIEIIGHGGMGTVYKAEQIFLHKLFALKVMNPSHLSDSALKRFQKEAKVAQLLDDHRLVKVFDFGLIAGEQPFLVMELVEGKTLSDIIHESSMPLDTVIDLFKQICEALNYAHSQGLIHRDLKPGNIIVSANDGSDLRVKIVDFGIAKVVAQDQSTGLTKTGDVFGTPAYMSPEQCQGLAVDERSDIYSLGCVLFEVLTGFPPFVGDCALATMMKHHSEAPPTLKASSPNTSYPHDLEMVIGKLLRKRPKERYQNLLDLAVDMDRIKAGQPVELGVHELTATKPAPKVPGSFIPIVLAALAALVVGVALGANSPIHRYSKATWQKPPDSTYAIAIQTANQFIDPSVQPRGRTVAEPANNRTSLDKIAHDFVSDTPQLKAERARSSRTQPPTGETRFFSQRLSLHPDVRIFTFPQETIGTVDFHAPTKLHRLENQAGTLSSQRQCSGAVVITDFQPLELKVDPTMSADASELMRFRPDEIDSLNFKLCLSASDKNLSDITKLESVRFVSMGSSELITDEAIRYFNQLPRLIGFELYLTRITIPGLLRLRRLDEFTDFGIQGLKDVAPLLQRFGETDKIEVLRLRDCGLDDDGAHLIGQLKHIRALDIRNNRGITDASMGSICQLKDLSTLRLEGCSVTSKSIAELRKLPKLSFVQIGSTFSAQDKAQMQQELPRCQIDFTADQRYYKPMLQDALYNSVGGKAHLP